MKLVHVDSERCGPKDRDKGCDPKLESIGKKNCSQRGVYAFEFIY